MNWPIWSPAAAIDRYLLPQERTRVVARPHWMALLRALLVRAGQVFLIWLLVKAAHLPVLDTVLNLPFVRELGPDDGPLPLARWVSKVGLLLFLLVLVLAGFDALRWWLRRFVLTDQRLLNIDGVVIQALVDSPLDRIDDLMLVQSWLGQQLDYGDLVVLRGGETGNIMPMMIAPLRFHQAMHAARLARHPRRETSGAREAPRPTSTSSLS